VFTIVPARPGVTNGHEPDPKEARRKVETECAYAKKHNEWWLILAGALSVLFGLIVLAAPGAGALALIWVIGANAIAFGAMLVGLSLRLRKHRLTSRGAAPNPLP
jgi:hypothetical protein